MDGVVGFDVYSKLKQCLESDFHAKNAYVNV
jgi:hypothetical protein